MSHKGPPNLKTATSFKEQLNLLRSRNLIIDNEQWAISVLKRVNYYRLSGYMLTVKQNDRFHHGIRFHHVYNLYQFDKKLRNLLLSILEDIEISFRTHVAYLIAHKYGQEGYRDYRNFESQHHHEKMLQQLEDEIEKSQEKFVRHHKNKYGARFPIWVAIELCSFGWLSRFYRNLNAEDRDEIAHSYYRLNGWFVSSWLHSLSVLRNACAHFGRLYDRKVAIAPKLLKEDKDKGFPNDMLFSCLFVMGRLHLCRQEWEYFVTCLAALIEQYSEIDLNCIGFPVRWEKILRNVGTWNQRIQG